ncbi:hypothetical protein TRVL_02688 [Trypanosoma vivax]|nr:hypothetical protein TRVL_02688 [Trypanosoma vivax]
MTQRWACLLIVIIRYCLPVEFTICVVYAQVMTTVALSRFWSLLVSCLVFHAPFIFVTAHALAGGDALDWLLLFLCGTALCLTFFTTICENFYIPPTPPHPIPSLSFPVTRIA